ncbi:MAG: hypothetical protein AUH86_10810 [Acidobacteria bacterium 13_1_40CM_4_58_4]|nr:MAG: hypothetical protein AUH86_10810 [Acidobacteria bacterium 13_1_40CM_4_58_4]
MVTSTMNPATSATLQAGPADVREYLYKARDGAEMTLEEGLRLATAEGPALNALVAVADHLRHETVGETITYVVNRNINFTNVCFVGCSFCGFGRGPAAPDAYSLSFEEVVRRAREAWDRGATEVCIQGGLPRDLDGFFYRDLLRAIKRTLPAMHVHAFSPMEMDYGVLKTGMPLRDYLRMMKDEGLGSIPGTAAEILDDRVRKELSPNKLPVRRWVEIITAAHELGIPTTSTMMYGHVEEPSDWVRHILLLRSIQKRSPRIHSSEYPPLQTRRSEARSKAGRTPACSRAFPRIAPRCYSQRPSLLGKTGIRNVRGLLAGRCQRFRRDADGRKHFQSRGRDFWRVRLARTISRHDSNHRPGPCGAIHDVQDPACF